MVTLKEYAKNQNISYEAVRKQVARYKDALGDHIIVNGKTQYLDEHAVKFLDGKRAVNAVHIIEHDKDEQIEDLKRQNENLLIKVAEQADKIAGLAEWKADNVALIAQAENRILIAEKKTETKVAVAVAEVKRSVAEERLLAVEQAKAELREQYNREIEQIRAELEAEKQKSWVQKLFGK